MVSVKMAWQGGIKFEGKSSFGNPVITDGKKESGGGEEGARATELMLFGVAGCTGVDIVRILKKQRQEVTGIDIEVVGHQRDEYPKPFHTVEVNYKFKGKGLDPAKVAKAIELSEGKYCVVSQTLRHETKMQTNYEIEEE